eukprot:6959654-Lingulodinium_polyedra.AAC.1
MMIHPLVGSLQALDLAPPIVPLQKRLSAHGQLTGQPTRNPRTPDWSIAKNRGRNNLGCGRESPVPVPLVVVEDGQRPEVLLRGWRSAHQAHGHTRT